MTNNSFQNFLRNGARLMLSLHFFYRPNRKTKYKILQKNEWYHITAMNRQILAYNSKGKSINLEF